ncbi:hypothetical protein ACMGD3_22705 [Lysinibacillus sphaericus]|uniref:hypothetical protein n=1 Tax=Lysinibacillus sphaericus TaxID=1421 RepID=UPI003F79DC42
MGVKRIEYTCEGCSLWVKNNSDEEIFHFVVSEFKQDVNGVIEDEEKSGLVLSIEDMRGFQKVLSESLEHERQQKPISCMP